MNRSEYKPMQTRSDQPWLQRYDGNDELLLFTITLLIFQKESWLEVSLIKNNVDATADEDDGEGQSLPV